MIPESQVSDNLKFLPSAADGVSVGRRVAESSAIRKRRIIKGRFSIAGMQQKG